MVFISTLLREHPESGLKEYIDKLQVFRWKVKVTQSRLTCCKPIDYIIHGILQAKILGWVDFSFSRGSS